MSYLELVIIAISLAMDSFAVAITKGFKMKVLNFKHTFFIALLFGFSQALMPFLGWSLSIQFSKNIQQFGHIIAFIVLSFIGVKMLIDANKDDYQDKVCDLTFNYQETILLAIATSIDALAVGVTFSFIVNINVIVAIIIIGIITFIFSMFGVVIGNKFVGKFGKYSQVLGGLILIILGSKFLLQQLL